MKIPRKRRNEIGPYYAQIKRAVEGPEKPDIATLRSNTSMDREEELERMGREFQAQRETQQGQTK